MTPLYNTLRLLLPRRGVRAAYGDGLENRCWCKPTAGSNPAPSAILFTNSCTSHGFNPSLYSTESLRQVLNMIEWNNKVKLLISDVDETIADLYLEAKPEMINELERLLSEGKVLFLVSGQSIGNIQWRITDHIQMKF